MLVLHCADHVQEPLADFVVVADDQIGASQALGKLERALLMDDAFGCARESATQIRINQTPA